jgi:Transglycosylase SLT domain
MRIASSGVQAALVFMSIMWITSVRAEPPGQGTDEVAALVWTVRQSELCTTALLDAEQRYHLPPSLLASIAKAESGRPVTGAADIRPWPWTIDADGTGLFFDSKAAAVAWTRAQAPRHRFIDVGCMQIDLHYHPTAFASLENAFDPDANADYAARLLLELYRGDAGGSWDSAVGFYHSHTWLLASQYRDRVALIGADILHGTLMGVPLYVRAIRAGSLRLPLGGGQVTLINVHRQPTLRSRHPFTTCQVVAFLGPYLNGARRGGGCDAAK